MLWEPPEQTAHQRATPAGVYQVQCPPVRFAHLAAWEDPGAAGLRFGTPVPVGTLREGCDSDHNCGSTTASSSSPLADDPSDRFSAEGEGHTAAREDGADATLGPRREQRIIRQKYMDPSVCTTVMMRSVPRCYTRDMLFGLFENFGFSEDVDFLYVPTDFATGANQAHAYVNLVSPLKAAEFVDTFNGFSRWWRSWCVEVCEVGWSCFEQGLQENVERYRNSPVMHPTVPDIFRPAIYDGGLRQCFPPPTRKLRVPRRAKSHFSTK